MSTEPGEMSIELLGPLSVRLNRVPIMPAAAKPREILALLGLNAGRVVTMSTLAEELWGDRPPPSAPATLQTYVLELRRRMAAAMGPGHDPKRVLRTKHHGYLLEPRGGRIDVEEFRQLARTGRAAAEGGDHWVASELLGRALALWRGPALVDVRLGRVLELEAMALEESRLAVLRRRIEADLALGRHADILGELTALAAKHPMNEHFFSQLITALYRAGHVARALEAFQRLRSALIDELGVEPSAQLQRLQQAVLSRDPALDAAETAGGRIRAVARRGCVREHHGPAQRSP
jgi:SARP family transcriptional regulator, regulator of embCAB operon